MRLRQIAIASYNLNKAERIINEELKVEVAYRDEEVERYGLNNIVCPIGGEFLEVVSPYISETTAGRFIDKKNGPTGYMTIFQCENSIERRNFIESMGIRSLNAFENKGKFIMTTLKVIPEEKPDINKVTTCSLLDKSAMSRNVFTEDECKSIIEMGRTWEQIEAYIQTKSPEAESEKNDDYRNCKMYGPPVDETAGWLWIGQKISAAIYNFNAKEGWKFNLIGMAERPMMMEYEEGQGKYDWHIDLGPSRLASTRKLGFTLFLNDDYEGGEFQIKSGRENYIPPQQETGNLLFFPSYLVHRVTLVTKGTRFGIIGWVHGNSFM